MIKGEPSRNGCKSASQGVSLLLGVHVSFPLKWNESYFLRNAGQWALDMAKRTLEVGMERLVDIKRIMDQCQVVSIPIT
jgi:hypothetical protein